jgi:hypothetical protein
MFLAKLRIVTMCLPRQKTQSNQVFSLDPSGDFSVTAPMYHGAIEPANKCTVLHTGQLVCVVALPLSN